MSLRIAFDLDGTLADLDSALQEIAKRLFGEGTGLKSSSTPEAASEREAGPDSTPKPGPDAETQPGEGPSPEDLQVEPARFRLLTRRQQHDLWDEVHRTENFWESLAETEPGIVARLAAMARERRWEVLFITQRPSSAGDTTQVQTQRWLGKHGFEMPSVYVLKGSRGKVADALTLDVVVDDRPENCLDVKLESRARAILVWSDDEASLPANARRLGIEPVPATSAALDLLTAAPADRPGVFSRLKKLIARD
jgi:hypothetical protein